MFDTDRLIDEVRALMDLYDDLDGTCAAQVVAAQEGLDEREVIDRVFNG